MKSVFSVTFMIAILATMTVVSGVEMMPEAEAFKKGQGVYNPKYGSATKGIVCGDRLCSEIANTKSSSGMSYPQKNSSSSVVTYTGSDLVESISGAIMIDTAVDKKSGTMVISINAQDDGKINLNLPSAINEAYMVIVDGEEWDDAYIDGNHIKVYFHAGTEKIEVIGNSSG